MRDKIYILIEPILRGSRLQLAYYFIESLTETANTIYLVTRNDYQDKHFDELIGNKYPNLVIVPAIDIQGQWNVEIKYANFKLLVKAAVELCNKQATPANVSVFFTAIDDYYTSLFLSAASIRKQVKGKLIYLRYRTEFLIDKPLNAKQLFKFRLQKIFLKHICKKNDLLLVMDERLLDNSHLLNFCRTGFIPEPWEGSFGQNSIEESRSNVNLPMGEFIFLTIGKQNKRKGLLPLLNALHQQPEILKRSTLLIVGKIENGIKEEASRLLNTLPAGKVILREQFVDEGDLPYYYDGVDCVVLPYDKEFMFTSGVLTRAAASKTPVVASNHGVIGYRVTQNNLGLTFPSESVSKLAERLQQMLENQSIIKSNQRQHIENIYNGRIDVFKTIFKKIIE